MKRLYLTEEICETIKIARMKKGYTSKEFAQIIGKSPSAVSRVENFKCVYIPMEVVKRYENELNIILYNTTDNNNELIKKIHLLQEENRKLKELLIDKWKGEENESNVL